jgi:thiosulfate dehydrogenase [quinone] large subunit
LVSGRVRTEEVVSSTVKEATMTNLKHVDDKHSGSAVEEVVGPSSTHRAARYALGALRIIVGWTFLWAFFDKLLALGYATGRDPETGAVDRFGDAAWIHGGSPTFGFLNFGADGPFTDFYHSIAGDTWADWAFMLGLLAIGVSLTFGVFTRLGTIAGVAMYLLMYTVVLPPENNPITDDHIIGAAVVLVLGLFMAGRYIGLGRWWESRPLMQKYPLFK